MTDLRTHAEEIQEQFSDQLDIDVDDVVERLETLVEDYQVPLNEARRSVVSNYLDEAGMERDQFGGGGGGNEARPGRRGRRTRAVDRYHREGHRTVGARSGLRRAGGPARRRERDDQVHQVGQVRPGGTGRRDGLRSGQRRHRRVRGPLLGEAQLHHDHRGTRRGPRGRQRRHHRRGALVDVQSGSGLIKRCPEEDCTRVLQNGRCSEHGEGEGSSTSASRACSTTATKSRRSSSTRTPPRN